MLGAMGEVLRRGENVALRMGYRVPTRRVAALPCMARNVRCCRSLTVELLDWKLVVPEGRVTPNRVRPLPKVAKGVVSSGLTCCDCNCASSACSAVLFA